jgi:hypothetical protein
MARARQHLHYPHLRLPKPAGAPHIEDGPRPTDDEKLALKELLIRSIGQDRYPLSPRIRTLKAILAKLDPPQALPTPITYPAPKQYNPPRALLPKRRRAGPSEFE